MYAEAVLSGLRLPEVPANPELRAELAACSLDELTAILAREKKLHNTTDVDTRQRAIRAIEIQRYYTAHPDEAAAADRSTATPPDSRIIVVDIPRDARRARISERLEARMAEGMADEIRGLIAGGVRPEDLIYYGLEYKFVTLYVTGQLTREEMLRQLETAIHQFAKRQMTWLRGMERRGFKLHYLPWDLPQADFTAAVRALL